MDRWLTMTPGCQPKVWVGGQVTLNLYSLKRLQDVYTECVGDAASFYQLVTMLRLKFCAATSYVALELCLVPTQRKYLKTKTGSAHIECVAQMPLLLIRLAEEPGNELEYLVITGGKYNLKQ